MLRYVVEISFFDIPLLIPFENEDKAKEYIIDALNHRKRGYAKIYRFESGGIIYETSWNEINNEDS